MNRNPDKFAAYLQKLFDDRAYPGMAVVIRGPGGMIFEKYLGKRSIARDLPVDRETVFGIASMSKSMTALALCMLAAEGRMSLEDPVSKYFPDFHIKGAADDAVTVRTLAMHTAGIPPIEPLEWSIALNSANRDDEWTREMHRTAPNKMDKIEQVVDYISNLPYKTLGAPGEYMSYSNEGYAIMSYIVDQVAGISLERFLDERIFKPLGMNRSILCNTGEEAEAIAAGKLTSLFEFREDKTLAEDDDWSVLPPFRGCACVKSTASDMTRYYKMLCDDGCWEGRRIVSKEAIRLMYGPQFPLEKERHYCMGLYKSLMAGKMVCEHSGGLHGVSTEGAFIEGGYSVAVLTNCGSLDLDEFRWACYNYVLGLPYETTHYWCEPVGREFSNPEMLVGHFVAHEGIPGHARLNLKDGRLKLSYAGIRGCEMKYCGGVNFAVYNPKSGERISTFSFFIRNGRAWGVKCGSRIYQRAK